MDTSRGKERLGEQMRRRTIALIMSITFGCLALTAGFPAVSLGAVLLNEDFEA